MLLGGIRGDGGKYEGDNKIYSSVSFAIRERKWTNYCAVGKGKEVLLPF